MNLRNTPNDAGDDTIAEAFDLLEQMRREEAAPEPELESYIDGNGKHCHRPRGEGARIRHENRARTNADKLRHYDAVSREVLALRLDAIDPDWPNKFLSTDEAARRYREQLAEFEQPLDAKARDVEEQIDDALAEGAGR